MINLPGDLMGLLNSEKKAGESKRCLFFVVLLLLEW